MFYMPLISSHLDPVSTPAEFLHRSYNRNSTHVLMFPFLFTPSTLVDYFRTLSYTKMSRAYANAGYTWNLIDRFPFIAGPAHQAYLINHLKRALARFLVLDVRRGNLLGDTFNQLWQRQKRELLRPLKVRMGAGEGEEGVDHGGVSQEFFRLALSDALDPDAGEITFDYVSNRRTLTISMKVSSQWTQKHA